MIKITHNNEDQLNKFVETIKLTNSLNNKIEQRYKSIGTWLDRDESLIKDFNPIIYSQGSVRTGTCIKPLNNGSYDVDLVCELKIDQDAISPVKLKKLVGDEIRKYMDTNPFKNLILEAKKCWTINYSDDVSFHVDILPCIKKEINNPNKTDILITNKDIDGYNKAPYKWENSNPKGFSLWLKKQEHSIFDCLEKNLKFNRKLENIPEHEVLTPLRATIMLLKRHRDVCFQFLEQQYKPTSVVITTLAASFYQNNPKNTTYDTLTYICAQLKEYIRNLNSSIDYILKSPHSEENFLDKWNKDKKYRENFELWVNKLNEDISEVKYFLNACKDTEQLSNDELDSFLLEQKHTKYKFSEDLDTNITCEIYQAENTCYIPHFQQKHINNRDVVPKNIEIKFIAKTNMGREKDFKVYWRVINTGTTAFKSKCLRGEMFCNSENLKSLTRVEPTAYSGVHSIEAFIVLNNKIIAKSTPFIIKIK